MSQVKIHCLSCFDVHPCTLRTMYLGDSVLPLRTPDSMVNHSPLQMIVLTLFLFVLYVLFIAICRSVGNMDSSIDILSPNHTGATTDLAATEKCLILGQIVERMHDWSQRSWVIAMAKSVAARSMVMFKTSKATFTPDRTISGS